MPPPANARSSSAASIASSDDFEVISDPGASEHDPGLDRSLVDAAADLAFSDTATHALSFAAVAQLDSQSQMTTHGQHGGGAREPPPTQEAREAFYTASLSAEEVQAYVRRTLPDGHSDRTVRVYVDGMFDGLHVGTLLQLRQAKLSFPSVHLIVGVLPDPPSPSPLPIVSPSSSSPPSSRTPALPLLERAELLRHIRHVDEIIPGAPRTLDTSFIARKRIDYIALEEGATVDPRFYEGLGKEEGRERVKGYDAVKLLGKVIPTRRTPNVVGSTLVLVPASALPTPTSTPAPDSTPRITPRVPMLASSTSTSTITGVPVSAPALPTGSSTGIGRAGGGVVRQPVQGQLEPEDDQDYDRGTIRRRPAPPSSPRVVPPSPLSPAAQSQSQSQGQGQGQAPASPSTTTRPRQRPAVHPERRPTPPPAQPLVPLIAHPDDVLPPGFDAPWEGGAFRRPRLQHLGVDGAGVDAASSVGADDGSEREARVGWGKGDSGPPSPSDVHVDVYGVGFSG